MRVKRYVVESMPSALQLIRKELGHDAVILNTKEVRTGGFLGFFSKKQIEVIAGLDTGSALSHPAPAPLQESNITPILSQIKEINAARAYATAAAERQAEVSEPPVQPAVEPPPSLARTELPPVTMIDSVRVDRSEPVPSSNEQLYSEIKQMKELMLTISKLTSNASPMPENVQALEERLHHHEVGSELIEKLMEQVVASANEAGLNDEAIRESLKQQIRNVMQPDRVQGIRPETKIVHLVGPTGVGKTTTVAKLAAEQVLKHRRKVGFITSDTYRIAAVEQLKTYANILNVPLEVVFSPNELARAFHKLEDRDIIFMDTAGRNFRNEMYVSELNSLLQTSGPSETYLVLNLTTRYRDMKAIVNNFSRFKFDKFLLTKSDETRTYGAMLNLLHDFPQMLSYITTGQNVPEDISVVNLEEWIDRLLEGDMDE